MSLTLRQGPNPRSRAPVAVPGTFTDGGAGKSQFVDIYDIRRSVQCQARRRFEVETRMPPSPLVLQPRIWASLLLDGVHHYEDVARLEASKAKDPSDQPLLNRLMEMVKF
ncbi:hypothetical protein HIM_11982 [Hirsutella minnesotensis 3608]|uniref:Uncharacterized protein n=1 Tax=Hirsutella minnesotensis 3608 TaxID=1043627 RepID=A0A0F7ZQX5_9HYPO|nr:hypothetical protein HIM_11982 [Hirsutella minnesotensis 3608]